MFYDKIIYLGLAISFVLGSALSTSALDAPNKAHTHAHKGYYKPGAAVALTYDYDGETRPGELETITLKLEHYYSDGYLSARLLETPDLQISSHLSLENEQLEEGSLLELPIQLSSTQLGEHFISLEIIYESQAGNQSLRVLSLPIQIGPLENSKSVSNPPQKANAAKGQGLVILNAHETIK